MARGHQVSALALFAGELRLVRTAAGLAQEQLGSKIGYSGPLIGHVAAASRAPSVDNALAGQVIERTEQVARVTFRYDILNAEALPPRASADLARKAIERWT